MPLYEFTCQSCGLRFEKLYRRVSDDATTPCEACGETADRQVTAANFAFSHPDGQLNGAMPPNTGTSDDWNFDKAIGRDAERRWGHMEDRRKKKAEVIRDEARQGRGITMDHLVKKPEGGYRVVEEPERKVINERREASSKIAKAAKEQGGKGG